MPSEVRTMARVDGLTARGREMAGLIAEWERSGQTMEEFAAAHRMAAPTFAWWRSQLKRRGKAASRGGRKSAIRLVEIERPGSAGKSFEVRLGNGVSVGVPAGFDRGALCELLSVLRTC